MMAWPIRRCHDERTSLRVVSRLLLSAQVNATLKSRRKPDSARERLGLLPAALGASDLALRTRASCWSSTTRRSFDRTSSSLSDLTTLHLADHCSDPPRPPARAHRIQRQGRRPAPARSLPCCSPDTPIMPARRSLYLPAALLLASSRLTAATPLLTDFASCLDPSGALVAPDDQLLKFTTLWTQFDTGQNAPGVQGEGMQVGAGQKDFLRATLVGTTGTQSEGYSSQTNFLGPSSAPGCEVLRLLKNRRRSDSHQPSLGPEFPDLLQPVGALLVDPDTDLQRDGRHARQRHQLQCFVGHQLGLPVRTGRRRSRRHGPARPCLSAHDHLDPDPDP